MGNGDLELAQSQERGEEAPSKLNRVRSLIVSAYAAKGLALVTTPITTRLLGPDGRGQYAAAMTFSTFAVAIATAGFGFGVAHEFANDEADEAQLMGSSFKYMLWLVLPCILLAGLLFIPPLNKAPDSTKIATLFLLWLTPVTVLGNSSMGLFTAKNEMSALSVMRLAPVATTSILLVAFAVTGTLTPSTAILAYTSSLVTAAIVGPLMVRVKPVWNHRIRPLLRFASRSGPAQIAMMANRSLDQLLVAPLLGFDELGFYSLSVVISTIPLSISGAVSLRSFSNMGSSAGFDGESAARYMRLTGLIVSAMCLLVAIPSPFFIPLIFGADFHEATIPLLLLLPGSVALCVAQITDQAFTLIGRPGTASVIELITLICTVIGLALTLGPFGIAGAAAVSSLSYILRLELSRFVLRKYGLGRITPKLSEWRAAMRLVIRE